MSRIRSFEDRTLSSRIGSTAALVLALAGCGGSSEGTKPIAVEDFAKALADSVCGNVGPCCRSEGYMFDSKACYAELEKELNEFVQQGRTTGAVYDPEAAGQCAADYANVARACGEVKSLEATCRKIFRGTLMAGEACTSSVQCVSGSCGPEGNQLVCDPKPADRQHGKNGDSCLMTCTTEGEHVESCGGRTPPGGGGPPMGGATCYTNDGLFCSDNFVCETMPIVGEACTSSSPCAGEAFCDGATCVPKRTSGSCANAFDACASSAFCDTATSQCLPKKSAGEPCSSTFECQSPNSCLSKGEDRSLATCRRRTVATDDVCLGK